MDADKSGRNLAVVLIYRIMRLIIPLIVIALTLALNTAMAATADVEQAFTLLTSKKFNDKSTAIDLLANSGEAKTAQWLNAILHGKLYYRKKDKKIVYAKKKGSKLLLTDALSGQDLGKVGKRKARKIGINNKLRTQLKAALASMRLSDPDSQKRLKAVEGLIGTATPAMLQRLSKIRDSESSEAVRSAIDIVTAFAGLDASSTQTQLDAIAELDGQLNPLVVNKLKQMRATVKDPAVLAAMTRTIDKIERSAQLYGYVETLFFGLSLGSILALAAIGLAITFGVMGVINMAHGELIMIGAYTTYVIQLMMPHHIGWSIALSIPAAFIVSALVGIAIERGVIRFLYGRPLETLLATFGISLVLQQTVRSIFSPLNRSVQTPEWMSGSLQVNSLLSITYNRLYIFAFCLIVFALLYLVMKKTSLGLHVRAVSQNRNMARAMGIKSEWVDAMTFGLGSGIAGVAGVALSQITNVGPNLGQAYIVDSFMVVVFGGVGNLFGTLISGLSLGVVGKFLEPATGAVLAKILVLVFIILFIQKRPRGLFPQKGRAAES